MSAPYAPIADRVAAKLAAAGLHVERKDYPALPGDDRPLNRSYVIVTDDEGNKVDWQAHEARPNGTTGGNPDSPLYERVLRLLDGPR